MTAMFDSFLIRALIAGLGLAVVTGPLGCFIVWRRMAYFGEALSHSALLGIALGFALSLPLQIGVVIICAIFAITIFLLRRQKIISIDALFGILAHSALAYGLIGIALMPDIRFDLHSILFGDILTVTRNDIIWIIGSGIVITAALAINWSKLLLASINEDLARAEGHNTKALYFTLLACLTLSVAIGVQVVGILLVTAMLIIPAASARFISSHPEAMAMYAILFGSIGVIGGLYTSLMWDIPTGPAIVAILAALFFCILVIRKNP